MQRTLERLPSVGKAVCYWVRALISARQVGMFHPGRRLNLVPGPRVGVIVCLCMTSFRYQSGGVACVLDRSRTSSPKPGSSNCLDANIQASGVAASLVERSDLCRMCATNFRPSRPETSWAACNLKWFRCEICTFSFGRLQSRITYLSLLQSTCTNRNVS